MTTLYRRLLGATFDRLPVEVRALHEVETEQTWHGRANVARGHALPARLIAALFRLPPAGADQPLTVTFTPIGDAERWVRQFGGARFVSTQFAAEGGLCERVGPVTLHMSLELENAALSLRLIGARLAGLPLPRVLLPRIRTREFEQAGRYRFEVEAHVPAFGLLLRYEGFLERVAR